MPSRISVVVLESPLFCDNTTDKWGTIDHPSSEIIRAYPPIFVGRANDTGFPIPTVEEILKFVDVKTDSAIPIPIVRSLPRLNETEDKKLWQMTHSPTFSEDVVMVPCNCIILETKTDADTVLINKKLVRELRRITNQVWLNRRAAYLDHPVQFSIGIDVIRKAQGDIVVSRKIRTGYYGIKRCDKAAWKNALEWSESSSESLLIDVVHEAHHADLNGGFHEHILSASIAIEILKYRLWDGLRGQHRCNSSQRKTATNDSKKPHRYFGEVLEPVVNRSLLAESRKTYEIIKNAWIMRGLVAHGKNNEVCKIVPEKKQPEFSENLTRALYTLQGFVSEVLEG